MPNVLDKYTPTYNLESFNVKFTQGVVTEFDLLSFKEK